MGFKIIEKINKGTPSVPSSCPLGDSRCTSVNSGGGINYWCIIERERERDREREREKKRDDIL